MKSFASYIVVALIAAVIVLAHPLIAFGSDDFTLTTDGYKVFSYGFPFRIVDCSAHLPIHMPAWQAVLRLISNFAVFFLPGVLILHAIRRGGMWRQRID